jgi:undecaprenyl-diphosphatase
LAYSSTKFRKFVKLLTIESIVAGAIFIVSILLFTFLANEIVNEGEGQLDINTYKMMASHISPLHTRVASFVTFFGSKYFLIPAYVLVIIYFIKKDNIRYSILVTVVALISFFSGFVFKEIFRRPRPNLPLITGEGGHSFPSGHSLAGFTFTGLIAWLVWQSNLPKTQKWICVLFMLSVGALIGLSRIYLRVHYASDVLGSLLLTATWLSLSFIVMRIIEKKFGHQSL